MQFLRSIVFLCFFVFVSVCQAQAFIVVNEILADPPAGLSGDANADGTTSSTQDEFLEIFNNGDMSVDLSSWSLADAVRARHIFPAAAVLLPQRFLVVFGGGAPMLDAVDWQLASSGTLSLNNDADTISLLDSNGDIIHQVIYGSEAGHDQSLTRFPEGEISSFVLHTSLVQAGGRRYSPGTFADGTVPLQKTAAVPEAHPFLCLLGGLTAAFFKTRKLSFARV